MNRAIIFGAGGQDGHYLKKICLLEGIEVVSVSRSIGHWTQGSVGDFVFVRELVKIQQPSYIFHLAANSTTRHNALFENHETISTGTLNILEAVKQLDIDCKVFITGSGIQFKNNEKAILESDEFEANCPYSISRIQSVYAARYYRTLGLKVYVGYLFHHESPYRKDTHVSKIIANAVRKINSGEDVLIELGDISVHKEWGFANDIAHGIFYLTSQNEVFEACIGTGVVYSIEDWLKACFQLIDRDWREYVKPKESFQAEYKLLFSNPSTLNRLGWQHQTSLDDLAKLMVFDNGNSVS